MLLKKYWKDCVITVFLICMQAEFSGAFTVMCYRRSYWQKIIRVIKPKMWMVLPVQITHSASWILFRFNWQIISEKSISMGKDLVLLVKILFQILTLNSAFLLFFNSSLASLYEGTEQKKCLCWMHRSQSKHHFKINAYILTNWKSTLVCLMWHYINVRELLIYKLPGYEVCTLNLWSKSLMGSNLRKKEIFSAIKNMILYVE